MLSIASWPRSCIGGTAARSTRANIRAYSYSRRCDRCPSIQFLGKDGWSAKRMPVPPSSDIMTIARVINSIRSSRLLFSSSSSENEAMFAKSEYVHPLSQIVLERLQSHHANWVKRMGLTTGLQLNKDGTFVLRFPGGEEKTPPDDGGVTIPGEDVDYIWTMYEGEESKHYLCVKKGGLVGRYMLQDNKKQAWHSDRRSTPERVQDAVDEMISKFDEVGWKKV